MDLVDILSLVSRQAGPQRPIYLVGGAVRDELLQRPVHDLDFVLPGPTSDLARRVAAVLGADFYRLDPTRQTSRVIVAQPDGTALFLDFASCKEGDLQADLAARDFTINAMARRLSPPEAPDSAGELIDPLGGQRDLRAGLIRACGPASLAEDPVRVLRAARLAVAFGFQVEAHTMAQAQDAAALLTRVSAERQRDELAHMLENPHASACVRLLERLGTLRRLLPEVTPLQGMEQPAPHIWDGWQHSLATLDYLEDLLETLAGAPLVAPEAGSPLHTAQSWLGGFRTPLQHHMAEALPNGRRLNGLLKLAALYHDSGKPACALHDAQGRLHFYGHDAVSARLVATRARALAYSNAEIERCKTIVREHMRVHQLARSGEALRARTVYRFFHACGSAGVDVCLLSLADTWATYGPEMPSDAWEAELHACQSLLAGYWEHTEQTQPTRLVDGNELAAHLGIRPGPLVGQLLEAIREAQVEGQVTDKASALAFATRWRAENQEHEDGHRDH